MSNWEILLVDKNCCILIRDVHLGWPCTDTNHAHDEAAHKAVYCLFICIIFWILSLCKTPFKNQSSVHTTPQEYSARPEFMFIEIVLSGADALLLGVCCRLSKIGYLTDFEIVLLRLMQGYGHVLTMGNIITDLLMTNRNMTILPLDAKH